MTDTLAHTVGVGWLRCNLKKEKKSCPRKRRIEFVPIRWQWQEHKPCLFYDGGFISKEKKNVLAPGKSSLKCVLWHLFHFPQFRHSRICLAFAIFVKTMSEHVWRLPCMPSPDDEADLIFFFFFAWKCCAHLNVCTTFSDHAAAPPPARRCGVTSSEARNRVAGESVTRLGLSMFVFPVVRLINHEYFMTACSPLDSTSPCDGEC